jgi:hypothetical protein
MGEGAMRFAFPPYFYWKSVNNKKSQDLPSGYQTFLVVAAQIISQESPAVFVFVAVNAEVLPVGAVRGIIPGVAVLMVHR